jgi:Holliday junction resolvase RusA-like endonuclease
MKRLLLAAALAASTAAFAQQNVEVPKAKCEPKPTYPGPRMREDATMMRNFKRDHDNYKKCMTDYLEERKAAIKSNEAAANAAVEEFNATMKALNDAQNAK